MKKQTLALITAITLGTVLLAGCGNSASNSTAANTTSAATEAATEAVTSNISTESATEEPTEADTEADDAGSESTEIGEENYDDTGIQITSGDTKYVIGEQGYYVTPIILHFGWYDKFLKDKGIDYEVATFNGGPEMIESFTAGDVDWGVMGLQPAVSGAANDAGVQVIASFVDQSRATVLATLDDNINSIEDLKGKKVASKVGSSEYAFLLWALGEAGLSESDIQIINVDIPAIATAVETGEVDAGVANINRFTQTESQDNIKFKYVADAVGSGTALQPIVVRTEFAKAHPDVIETTLKLYQWAIDWINNNHDEAVKIISDYYGTDVEVPETVLTYQTYGFTPSQEFYDSTDKYIDFMYNGGYINKRVDTASFVDLSYAKAIGLPD